MNESETLTKRKEKSMDRLKDHLVFLSVRDLKLRKFVLDVLKRARLDRVWRVVGPVMAARTKTLALSKLNPRAEEFTVDRPAGVQGEASTKRAARPTPATMDLGSPSSSATPSKSRPRIGLSTEPSPAGNGPG